MKHNFILLLVGISIYCNYSCTSDTQSIKTKDSVSLQTNDHLKSARADLFVSDTNEHQKPEESRYGKGQFLFNNLKKFDREILSANFATDNKIDSASWVNFISKNYDQLNSPAGGTYYLSKQPNIGHLKALTIITNVHHNENMIIYALVDSLNHVVNSISLATTADGCGGISGYMESFFDTDSTFKRVANFGEYEIFSDEKEQDRIHYEEVTTFYKIQKSGDISIIKSDTIRRFEKY